MVFISHLVIPEGIEIKDANLIDKKRTPLLSYLIPLAEQVSFFMGVLLLFWNFHPAAAGLFLVVAFVALLAVRQVERRR
jgi:hypothetical protein